MLEPLAPNSYQSKVFKNDTFCHLQLLALVQHNASFTHVQLFFFPLIFYSINIILPTSVRPLSMKHLLFFLLNYMHNKGWVNDAKSRKWVPEVMEERLFLHFAEKNYYVLNGNAHLSLI